MSITLAPPLVALVAPVATGEDIRVAIEILNEEAEAHDAIGGHRHHDRADQLRRVVTLLRANLHRVGA
jgi:hypothetical protein